MNQLWVAAFTFASAITILAQAFTLTYKTTKIPNFSQGIVMISGSYVTYASTKALGLHYLLAYPLAFVAGALVSTVISLLVIEPLLSRKRGLVLITLATMGVGIVGENLIKVFAFWAEDTFQGEWLVLHLHESYPIIGELSGTDLAANILAFLSIFFIRWMSRSTSTGVHFRALEENIELAQVQGLNPRHLRFIVWALAGGLSGLAGAIMVTRFHLGASSGWVIWSIFAAVLLGGMDSLQGAVVGGLVVGLSEILLVSWGQSIFGVWVGEFRFLLPLSIIVLVTGLKPNGLLGSDLDLPSSGLLLKLNKNLVVLGLIFLIGGGLVMNTVFVRNRIAVREELMDEFSGYDLIVKERDKKFTSFHLRNFTVFKAKLEELGITTVYVKPFTDSSMTFTFYYERSNIVWRTSVRLEFFGFFQYRIASG